MNLSGKYVCIKIDGSLPYLAYGDLYEINEKVDTFFKSFGVEQTQNIKVYHAVPISDDIHTLNLREEDLIEYFEPLHINRLRKIKKLLK